MNTARVMILLPTTTYRARDFLDAARKLDIEIVLASDEEPALAAELGDNFLLVDFDRVEEAADRIVALSEDRRIDAVVPVDDRGVSVAAEAAERLGLPHNPPHAVLATRNKATLRRRLDGTGIPQPRFSVAGPTDDVAALAEEIGFPCVVKAVSLSASRGVLRVDTAPAAAEAAARIRLILEKAGHHPSEPLLVEAYLPGVEVVVEALVRNGTCEVLAILDKPDPMEGPTFEETMFVTPSRLPETTQAGLASTTADVVNELDLVQGPIHAEYRVDGDQIGFLEVAARSIGGLCGRALRFGLLGASLEEILLRGVLDLPIFEIDREKVASGVMMLPIPRSGVLRKVANKEAALATKGITSLQITAAPDTPLAALPEGDRYLGFLFAKAQEPADVEVALRTASGLLEIVIDDE